MVLKEDTLHIKSTVYRLGDLIARTPCYLKASFHNVGQGMIIDWQGVLLVRLQGRQNLRSCHFEAHTSGSVGVISPMSHWGSRIWNRPSFDEISLRHIEFTHGPFSSSSKWCCNFLLFHQPLMEKWLILLVWPPPYMPTKGMNSGTE